MIMKAMPIFLSKPNWSLEIILGYTSFFKEGGARDSDKLPSPSLGASFKLRGAVFGPAQCLLTSAYRPPDL